jgi:transcriptional regulator with XRE-family HTH domain
MKIRRKPQPARRYETQVLDIKAALARGLRRRRAAGKISQGRLAARLGSSQSRISKIEAGDPAVSLDLFVRALFAAGASRGDIARAVGSA